MPYSDPREAERRRVGRRWRLQRAVGPPAARVFVPSFEQREHCILVGIGGDTDAPPRE